MLQFGRWYEIVMNDHDTFFQHMPVDTNHLAVDQEHPQWWQQHIETSLQHFNQQS